MFVCLCHAVSESDVHAAVLAGHVEAAAVAEHTGASTGCGTCTDLLSDVVDRACRTARIAS